MKKIGLLFPGQGAQSAGMFQELYERCDVVRETFCEAETVLNRSIAELCFQGPDELLAMTENTQVCILTCEVAAWRLAQEMGLKPEVIFGFSLGECAALIAAECIPFAEGLRMVAYRAKVMQEAVPLGQGGMMAVLGKSEEQVRMLCDAVGEGIWMANYNCPGQIVCTGKAASIDRALTWSAENGYVVKKLGMSIPSHCPLMQPASEALGAYLKDVSFADARTPILCGSTAKLETDGALIKMGIIEQLVQPVRCEESLRQMLAMDVNVVVEAGPGHVLTSFMRKIDKGVGRFCLSTPAEAEALLDGMKES